MTDKTAQKGSAGGIARSKLLSPERRKEIAKEAARSRWGDRPDISIDKDVLEEYSGRIIRVVREFLSSEAGNREASDIARSIGKSRANVQRILDHEGDYRLKSLAEVLLGMGYRLDLSITPVNVGDEHAKSIAGGGSRRRRARQDSTPQDSRKQRSPARGVRSRMGVRGSRRGADGRSG